jgi:ribose transport system permease protein
MAATSVVAVSVNAMHTRSISPSSHGNFYELYAIAASVLGGFSLRGGEGSLVGVVLGTILLQLLQNLVNLVGIPSSLNFAVMGSVILIGFLADAQFSEFRKRRSATRHITMANRELNPTPGILLGQRHTVLETIGRGSSTDRPPKLGRWI